MSTDNKKIYNMMIYHVIKWTCFKFYLFDLLLYVPVIICGYVGTLSSFYGTSTSTKYWEALACEMCCKI